MNRRDFGKVMLGVTGGLIAGTQLATVASAGEEKEKVDLSKLPKHECKGQNECKGQGGCKPGDNGCAGKNSCKGKGGCKTPVDPAHLEGSG
ncbi:MAG: hypothetical protein ACREVI_12480 [Steroidobacteraceae bacterium]